MRSFTISADRVGPRRWCWVRIHDTVEGLQRAKERLNPGGDTDALGCFQPTSFLRGEGGHITWPSNGYAGLIRLAEPHVTAEIVSHELVHAAAQIYRMNVALGVRLGTQCGAREEEFAYIYGELYADLESKLA